MHYRLMLTAGIAAIALAGCSGDPKAASKGNFQAALQKWYDAHPECVSIGSSDALTVAASGFGKGAFSRIPDALAKAGLVTREEGTDGTPGWDGKPRTDKVIRYRPTAKAGDAIRPADDHFIGGTNLCFAHRQIEEVTSFTEPADMMGVRVSQASYRYRLRDVASWASDPAIGQVLPAIGEEIAAVERDDKAGLVLTGDGWAHEGTLRK